MTYRFLLNGVDVCAMGLESARLDLRAGGPDRLTWSRAAGSTETPPAIHAAAVLVAQTLDDDGEVTASTTLFSGRVISAPRSARETQSGYDVAAENGWGDLRRVVMTQAWASWNPATESVETVQTPRVLLGMSDAGAAQNTGQTIASILAKAAAAGANVATGTIDPALSVPPTELIDATCDAALRQILAYHPDAVAWMEGATMNVRLPTNLPTVAVDECADALDVNHDPQTDEIPSGVVIVWERTHDADGVTRIERIHQTAGETSGWPPPIYMTIPLAGASSTTKQQVIETRTIPNPEALASTAAKDFYRGLIPGIQDAEDADLAIVGQTVEFADPRLDQLNEDGETVNPNSKPVDRGSDEPAQFPRMLINGQVQEWMPGSLKQYDAILKASVYYRGNNAEIRQFVGSRLELAEPITITNALPKTYRVLEAVTLAEQPIEGLASSYYAAISQARDEGSISGDLAGKWLSIRPGRRVTVAGKVTSPAVIRETSIDLLGGNFRAAFGTAEFLNPKTIADLARAMARNRPQWRRAEERTQAQADGATAPITEGAKTSPTHAAPTKREPRIWDIDVVDPAAGTVRIARAGTIIPDASNVRQAVSIADIAATWTVAAGDVLYLRLEGWGADMEATLLKGSGGWSGDTPITVSGELPNQVYEYYHYAIWEFAASPSPAGDSVKISDSLFARKLAPESAFVVKASSWVTDSGQPILGPVLEPYHAALSPV